MDNYISKYIKRKSKQKNIVNIYSDSIFVDFYNNASQSNHINNDIQFYKNNINKNEIVLELACGSGRIMAPLLDSGFNITGIEIEKEMLNSMKPRYKKHAVLGDILSFESHRNLYSTTDVFILGATTISLFSPEKIKKLLENLRTNNSRFRIYFDFIDLESLVNQIPKKEITGHGTFFYCNFNLGNKVIYNLYHLERDMIGYSVKYNYNLDNIRDTLEKKNINMKIHKYENNYYMIEGEYIGS